MPRMNKQINIYAGEPQGAMEIVAKERFIKNRWQICLEGCGRSKELFDIRL
jgi:hypothetical protein